MGHNIDYDNDCECYVWRHNGGVMCLAAETLKDAIAEVDDLIAHGHFPEVVTFVETLVDDDASAFASAGWGTDEDYGHFGGDDY